MAPAPAQRPANPYPAAYGYPPAAPPRGRSAAPLIVAIALISVVVVGLLGVGGVVAYRVARSLSHAAGAHPTAATATSPPAGPVDASTHLFPDRGLLVYSDDFSDPNSGWFVGSYTSGTTMQYGAGSYIVVGKGSYVHEIEAPYAEPHPQVSATVVGTQSVTASQFNGFGVECVRGSGVTELTYAFVLETPGEWYIERFDGATAQRGSTVQTGSTPVSPGDTPITVVGMCVQLSDGTTTRLEMFVNGNLINNFAIDASGQRSDAGWQTGIVVKSHTPSPATVTITRFEERDLTR